jgi:chemotaxis protein methyltransferase CheR
VTSPEAVRRFRRLVVARFGLQVTDDQCERLSDVLLARLHGRPVNRYLDALERGTGASEEWRALASELTVSETYFFRNMDHFVVLRDAVLPALAGRRPERPIAILSAGAASGEEGYSVAIVVDQLRASRPLPPCDIVAIDVSDRALQKARRAHYSEWALRGTPPDIRAAYFKHRGREYALRADIVSAVRFEERNLLEPDPEFWRPNRFDVMFFRNTFMYFAPEVARSVLERLTASLVPGGCLFLGHAETLRGLSDEYDLQHTHGTFYYRRRGAAHGPATPPDAHVASASAWSTPTIPVASDDADWFSTIGDATARVTRLVDLALVAQEDEAKRPRPDGDPAGAGRQSHHLAAALTLLGEERFAEALVAVDRGGAPLDADGRLLRAVILTSLGRFGDAAHDCEAVLRADPLSAGAHYLLAVHARHANDIGRARQHDEAAIYLDPAFAMPRLHLGILERRAGRTAAARGHLAAAVELLRREDPGRVLLFGGGFTRSALLKLCEAEVKQLEKCQ